MSDDVWTEEASQTFIDYGRYFVPERELQIKTVAQLIPATAEPFAVLELCCGEGLLAEAILSRYPQSVVYGYDGSQEMLKTAADRLRPFGERFKPVLFDLMQSDWRTLDFRPLAIVSSLAVHHLDGQEKAQLFADLYGQLAEGGALLIADLIQPAEAVGVRYAADQWDAAVQERSVELTGDTAAFDYFDREKWNIFTHPDPMDKPSGVFEQLRWLAAAGFSAVDVYYLKAGHAIYGGRHL